MMARRKLLGLTLSSLGVWDMEETGKGMPELSLPDRLLAPAIAQALHFLRHHLLAQAHAVQREEGDDAVDGQAQAPAVEREMVPAAAAGHAVEQVEPAVDQDEDHQVGVEAHLDVDTALGGFFPGLRRSW
eukprot:Opistho-2@7880